MCPASISSKNITAGAAAAALSNTSAKPQTWRRHDILAHWQSLCLPHTSLRLSNVFGEQLWTLHGQEPDKSTATWGLTHGYNLQ